MKFWFNEKVVISRLEEVGNKSILQTITSDYAHIQQLNEEKTAMLGGAFGKTYKMWISVDADVTDGDQITGEDGKRYKIMASGVNTRSFGIEVHQEIVLQRIEEQYND